MKKCEGFPDRYIASVKTPDGRLLRLSRKVRNAFQAHFRNHFARCTDLTLQEFHSYLANFPCLGAAEVASCEGVVTECEVRDVLKQVSLNKSQGLDGLPYEVYLRMSHMFVPILTDMFNHWFAQGAIPGSVTKGMITLLKKGGRHVWEGLDDYRPITLLNTELKILAQVLANRLQIVISNLIAPEQTFAVKGRSIQDNLHLIREVLEGIEDDTEASLLRQWCRWTEGIQGCLRLSVRSGRAAPSLLFSMSSLWSPCSVGLRMRGQIRPSAVSLLLALFRQGFLRSLISQSLYPTT